MLFLHIHCHYVPFLFLHLVLGRIYLLQRFGHWIRSILNLKGNHLAYMMRRLRHSPSRLPPEYLASTHLLQTILLRHQRHIEEKMYLQPRNFQPPRHHTHNRLRSRQSEFHRQYQYIFLLFHFSSPINPQTPAPRISHPFPGNCLGKSSAHLP